ncbi:MAG: class I adenylate-forming enzyme family protein, partial [Microbacterium sp.]
MSAPISTATIPELLAWAATAHGARPALTGLDGAGGWTSLGFDELRDLSLGIGARFLAEIGERPGQPAVAWVYGADSGAVAELLHLSITSAGLLSVPVNPASSTAELLDHLERTDAALIVASRAVAERLGGSATRVLPVDRLDELLTLAIDPQPARDREIGHDTPAVVLFTSGTTGRSKGVVHSHGTSLAAGRGWQEAFELTSADTYQSMFPVYSGAGLHFSLLACLIGGARNVVDVTRPTRDVLARVQEYRTTVYAAVPSIFQYWLEEDLDAYDLSSLRLLDFGGSVMHRSTIEALRAALPRIQLMQTYGLTEAGPGGLYLRPGDLDRKLGSIGSVGSGGLRFRIDERAAAERGEQAEAGEQLGELEFRGPSIMLGYLNDPETTAKVHEGEWMRTGDYVRIDADGFVYFIDRLKDLIIRGGFNISSVEVEEALLGYPGVTRVSAFGVAHHQLGEVVGVAVVAEDRSAFDLDAFRGYAQERLARVKVPAWVVVLDELPVSSAGKV